MSEREQKSRELMEQLEKLPPKTQERIGYMIDPGQGNNSGGRAPWLLAKQTGCPYPPDFGQTRNFVEKTLKPRMEK